MSLKAAGKLERRYLLPMLLVPAGLLALLVVLSILDEDLMRALIEEDGVIETASAAGYFVAIAAVLFYGGWRMALLRAPYITLILAFLGLRELDIDKRFTTMGIFKTEFYLSPDVSWIEKALAVLFFAFLIWVLLELADRHGRWFLAGLRRVEPAAVGILLAALFAGAAKSLDGLARKLDGFGLEVSARGYTVVEGAEEILELGIPLLLILAVLAWFSARRKAEMADERS